VIPAAFLQAWSARVPWPDQRQVEQDLIICRALCDLFNADALAETIAFRGGTAIHKLLFARPLRYSEDIDLVQTKAGPIGKTVDAIRGALAWLGPCKRTQATHSMHLYFSFTPEGDAAAKLKLKVEINTREHSPLYPIRAYPFSVQNPWYTATSNIRSFAPEELFGTKLRALLQRRKSRDLFDLNEGLTQLQLDPSMVIAAFEHYLAAQGAKITRAQAEEFMLSKLTKKPDRRHRAPLAGRYRLWRKRRARGIHEGLVRAYYPHRRRPLAAQGHRDQTTTRNPRRHLPAGLRP
jgi:predicted nucleotidyltransferase component of viral defense system